MILIGPDGFVSVARDVVLFQKPKLKYFLDSIVITEEIARCQLIGFTNVESRSTLLKRILSHGFCAGTPTLADCREVSFSEAKSLVTQNLRTAVSSFRTAELRLLSLRVQAARSFDDLYGVIEEYYGVEQIG